MRAAIYTQPFVPLRRGRSGFRLARTLMAMLLVLSLPSCASETKPPEEGDVAFRAGAGPSLPPTAVEPGTPLRRLGILTPAVEPRWDSAWVQKNPGGASAQGTQSGFMTGLSIINTVGALALTFWPAAVGVAAGLTIMGLVGANQETPEMRRAAPDREAIAEATAKLQPDRILRDAFSERVARRTGRLVVPVLVQDANISGSDPLAEARQERLDGVVNLQIEFVGLAAGEDTTQFGVFAQARMRIVDLDGHLRYDRTVAYGPGQPVPELPRSTVQTLDFLAYDRALVYRQSARDTIRWIGLLFAEDPALPIK
jgi:hypothetical protein